tara:strand:+ start:153 stop:1931 length:1779 start_codon:yes stop_codon:yes gene_type:complete
MPNFFINVKSKGAGKAGKDIQGLTGNLNGMARAAKRAAIVFGVGFLGKQIFDVGRSALKTAATFETLKVRLTALYGSVDRGTKAFANFNKVAATTPFQLQDVVDAGASLKAFGLDAEEMIKPLADLAAFMQVDMSVAASNMGRAFVAGAGAADMFREKGINQMIADMAGVMDATKLPIEQYRETLQKVLIDPKSGIAGMTTKMADTWSGAVSNFQDGADRLKAAMGDELINFLRPKLDAINAELSKIGAIGWDNIAKTIFDNSGLILTKAAEIFGMGGKVIGLTFVDAVGDAFETLFPKIRTLQALLLPIMPSFALGLKQSSIEFNNHDEEINKLTKSMGTLIVGGYEKLLVTSEKMNLIENLFPSNTAEEIKANQEDLVAAFQNVAEVQQRMTIDIGQGRSDEEIKEEERRERQKIWIEGIGKSWKSFYDKKSKLTGDSAKDEMQKLAMQSNSATDAMKNVVKAETMEAISGLISSILRNVAYPFNLILAAGAGGVASSLITSALSGGMPKFAMGGDFVTSGPQMIMVGDNPGGQERVQVTPLSSPAGADAPAGGNITLNISAPLVDETVVDTIIPSIREALRRGEDIGIS